MKYAEPNKDLFNNGQCFTKGKLYPFEGTFSSDTRLINDLGEPHLIGASWIKNFKEVKQ